MEKCHFVGVAPIEPLGLFWPRGPSEMMMSTEKYMRRRWSTTKKCNLSSLENSLPLFSFFAFFLEQHFPKCRENGQSLLVRGLTYSMWPWCHGCSSAATSPEVLIGAKFDSPGCWPVRGFRSESLSQDFSTNGHRTNRPRHFTRGRRARSRSVPRGGEEHERPRKLSRQTPRFGSSPIACSFDFIL